VIDTHFSRTLSVSCAGSSHVLNLTTVLGSPWSGGRHAAFFRPFSFDTLPFMMSCPVDREEILVRLRERIVAFAASRIAGDVAEDLAQELLPLSLQILRFKMMAVYRKAERRGERGSISVDDLQVPDLGPDPAAYLEQKEMVERLRCAMSGLCERCRQLMRLKLEGRSFAEIQKHMGAGSINTVYTWDFRCRKELLDLLGGSWEGRQ
jgi:RNA polymerase sigma-70 factor (ECF subfamily)